MRAAMGAIQRLGKDHYRVSIELPPDDGKRKRRTKVVRGKRSEAEAELARMKLELGKESPDDMELSRYWELYYEPSLASLAPATIAGYKRAWNRLVEPRFGSRMMGSLKAREIEAQLLTIEKPGEQRNAFKLMRQMFNEAYRDEIIESNPFHRRIRLKRMETYEPQVLLMDDIPAWTEAVKGSAFEPVLLVMLFGGLRREEASALYWHDISFSEGLCAIRIDKALVEVSGKVSEGPTKTASSRRTVYIGGYAAERLWVLEPQGPIHPLVPDANGNRMAPDKMSREYHKLMLGKEAKYVPMRNLRNSYATIMQGLGASDSLISKSLGHTNLKVDYDHYFAANAPAHMENARMLGEAVLHRVTS